MSGIECAAGARRGIFVTLEGGEGVGKSTQVSLLADRLGAQGLEVVRVHEPGGTPVGDSIRRILLDTAYAGMSGPCELLLYEASRAELVAKVLRPALERGAAVVCDRFTDSTLAYQGFGRRLAEVGLAELRALNEWATSGLEPDRTVLLDLDPASALARATEAGADRLESEDLAFHERVREGFLAVAEEEPGRVVAVDASGPPEAVAERVWEAVAPLVRGGA